MLSLQDLVSGYNKKSKTPAKVVFKNLFEYSDYVVKSRAIPSLKDGLKPSQRIALWVSLQNKRGAKIKTIGLVGSMLSSNLYHHGDASAAAAINMMAAPYLNNRPLFTGHGAFGTLTNPKSFGAARYTSVSTSNFAKQVLTTDEALYKMEPSIDGDAEMCESFLPLIPLILLNGSSGMAIGYSTDILPHSFSSLKKAVIDKIDGKKIQNILPAFEKFDLDITLLEGLSYWVTGKVKILNTTTVEIISNSPNSHQEKLKAHLYKLRNLGIISSFSDQTSDTFSIIVKMTRSNLSAHSDKLAELFKLGGKMSERLVTIGIDEKVHVYENHDDLISDWVTWRFAYYLKRFENFKTIASTRLTFLEDVIRCIEGNLPHELNNFKNKSELTARIKELCQGRHRPQIAEFPTYKWTADEIHKTTSEIKTLQLEINFHNKLIKSDDARWKLFKKEVSKLKSTEM